MREKFAEKIRQILVKWKIILEGGQDWIIRANISNLIQKTLTIMVIIFITLAADRGINYFKYKDATQERIEIKDNFCTQYNKYDTPGYKDCKSKTIVDILKWLTDLDTELEKDVDKWINL